MKILFQDCYEMLRNNNGLSRRALLLDYFRIRSRKLLGLRTREVPVLGSSLRVLFPGAGFHLYREIIIAQVYSFSCKSPRPLIIDCGSNVGMSVLFFKKRFPNARVIGIEADPETFRMLEENVKANRLADVTLHNKAVADKDGTISFYMNPGNPGDLGMSTISQGHLPTEVVVPAVRLSSLIANESVDFLKLDIEGAETEVIDELDRNGALRQIDQMVVEYHHHIAGKPETLAHILGVLVENGFGYQLRGPDGNFWERESFQVVWIYAYRRDPS
jgi:FkbM family methyltransferase